MDEFLSQFPDVPEVDGELVAPEEVPPPRKLSREEIQMETIKEAEAEIQEQALTTIKAAGLWIELDHEHPEIMPEDWPRRFGPENAKIQHRIAHAACLDAKHAPVGLKIAKETAIGMAKAHAMSRVSRVALNIGEVKMLAPAVAYAETEVDD